MEEKGVSIKQQIHNFNSKVAQKWTGPHRSLKRMLGRKSKWLDEKVTFKI